MNNDNPTPNTEASSSPRDQQWLQEVCELVRNKMPDSHTFVVFAFPASGSDRCYYASNATRESAMEALRQWLSHQSNIDHWMKHDDTNAPPSQPNYGNQAEIDRLTQKIRKTYAMLQHAAYSPTPSVLTIRAALDELKGI